MQRLREAREHRVPWWRCLLWLPLAGTLVFWAIIPGAERGLAAPLIVTGLAGPPIVAGILCFRRDVPAALSILVAILSLVVTGVMILAVLVGLLLSECGANC